MVRRVEVVPHDPNWARLFQVEAQNLCAVFGAALVSVHHIGSTAIPNISAKPIIDILLAVRDIEQVDGLNAAMVERGYQPRGEYGIPGRRYFVKGDDSFHSHHLHVFQDGNPEVDRHLAFRDYMIAHPEDAAAYGRLKEQLAARFPEDIEGYMDGKDGFIKEIDRKAKAWRESHPA